MQPNYKCVSLIVILSTICVRVCAEPPNVVMIMADDLGYHDLGCYGHAEIQSPVLDKLAKNGVRLTSFYAGATVCTPSRMALLTGAYPSRLGWTKGVIGYIMKDGTGLSPNALTIAEVFKQNGYRTGMVGKWHLGDAEKFRPHRQGFDSTFYIKRSNNQTDELWRNDDLLEKPFNNRLLTEKFTKEAIRFIDDCKSVPFFLYVPYTAPHFPVEAHPDWKGKSKFGTYGAVVEEMDHRIGQILTALHDNGLEQNTIVVFLSDNGPEPLTKESKATPFRGKKWDALEGGTRVPCIVSWPGVIPKASECNDIVAAIDLKPTLCHACGIDLDSISVDRPRIDGLNVWSTLVGDTSKPHARRELLFWHGSAGFQAIRIDNWKLFINRAGAKLNDDLKKGPLLFNLDEDAAELVDRSNEYPEKVQQMQQIANKRLADIQGNSIPLGQR